MITAKAPLGAESQLLSLSLPRGFVLNEKSEAAVGILFELRQHGRVEQVAVERIGDEEKLYVWA